MSKITFVIIFVALAISVIASLFRQPHNCSYSNYNGTFTFEEKTFNGRDFDICKARFEEFKKINRQDTVLYRICRKGYAHFWESRDRIVREKYKRPYMSWSEISDRRGAVENKTGFQDF